MFFFFMFFSFFNEFLDRKETSNGSRVRVYTAPMRGFHHGGPCLIEQHYMVRPEARLPGILAALEEFGYLVIHGARRSGRTTLLVALARELNASGRHAALRVSCAEAAGAPVDEGEALLLEAMSRHAEATLHPSLRPPAWDMAVPGRRLGVNLARWASACPRHLVLLLDDADDLDEEQLRSLRDQLRARYPARPTAFPAAVVICVKPDRLLESTLAPDSAPHPFDRNVRTLELPPLSPLQVASLLGEQVREQGLRPMPGLVPSLLAVTRGQPFFVCCLLDRMVQEALAGDRPLLTRTGLQAAAEALIRERVTHLNNLNDILLLDEVRPIVQRLVQGLLPMVGDRETSELVPGLRYLRDIGIFSLDLPPRPANPILHEVLLRMLVDQVPPLPEPAPRTALLADGTLDLHGLWSPLAALFRKHAETLAACVPTRGLGHELLFLACLHRGLPTDGRLRHRYGHGPGRLDVQLVRPLSEDGSRYQVEVLLLRTWRPGHPDPLRSGLAQIEAMLRQRRLSRGTLVLFDRRVTAMRPRERIRILTCSTPGGFPVVLLRL